jgi:hypothetical protein
VIRSLNICDEMTMNEDLNVYEYFRLIFKPQELLNYKTRKLENFLIPILRSQLKDIQMGGVKPSNMGDLLCFRDLM